jgi:hypothetical protein
MQVPVTLISANQSDLTKLRGLSGAEFDKRYASDSLVVINQLCHCLNDTPRVATAAHEKLGGGAPSDDPASPGHGAKPETSKLNLGSRGLLFLVRVTGAAG